MTETLTISTAVAASLSSGVLLAGSFSEVHKAAEFLMGHPIWTHHFASKQLWDDMRKTILAQCPDLPTEIEGVTRENYRECLEEIEAKIGKEVTITKGSGLTAMLPTDGVPDHLKDKTIFVKV